MKSQRLVCRLVVLLGIGAGVLVMPALAQDCPELVGQLPGSFWAVAASGDYAYLGSLSGLAVADVSSPSAPWVVGEVALPNSPVNAVAVSGGHAYVAYSDGMSQGGLRVIDVSTPSAPFVVGSFTSPGYAHDVAVSGGYAYVGYDDLSSGAGVLRVIDVSTPSAPVEVGFVDTPGPVSGVAVGGGYAYVAGWGGLSVIDVSTPSQPVEVGSLPTPQSANDVAVLGGYAYLADDFGLRVIDVSSPSAPTEVGFISTSWLLAWSVAVSNGHVYVAGGDEFGPEGGLLVVDVSTPSAPVEVGFFETVNDRFDVSVSGGYVFVSTDLDGLYVFRECGTVFVDGFESGDTSAWSATVP